MTPLALRILRDSLLPPRSRLFRDRAGVLSRMLDMHCFEVTDAFEIAGYLGRDIVNSDTAPVEILGFLPAPVTWLEWRCNDGSRRAVLLECFEGAPGIAAVNFCGSTSDRGGMASHPYQGGLVLAPSDFSGEFPAAIDIESETDEQRKGWIAQLYGLLAMINTPRLIGRNLHNPNRGLEKRLAHHHGRTGYFPLHAWTEIVLGPDLFVDLSREPETEARLSGHRARHFVRAHLRIRCGHVEFVRSHWRGDAALGIRNSRYRLDSRGAAV